MKGKLPLKLLAFGSIIMILLWEMPSASSACGGGGGGCRGCIVDKMMKDCPKCCPIMQCMSRCLWGSGWSARFKCAKKCDCNTGGFPRLSDCKHCLSQCKCSCSV
ncbi:hypothetical protein DM860_003630 [Cuscuta australis]|uniref:Uncharacterized protein n=1 Tax=Cuscuta australis TaxID=267555 RepID=A0A328DL33_9ASTE|nr:hypothetical protein DM860_003630 [Cuscuta australis]